MPKAQVNGVSIYYEDVGQGIPVAMMHGFGESSYMFHNQMKTLSRHCRLILPDARGHGQSDVPQEREKYSSPIFVEDLYQLLRHLGIRRAIITGHSMGGYVACWFYLAHPEMVQALALIDAGPGYRNPQRSAEADRRQEEIAQLLEREGMEGYIASQGEVAAWAPREVVLRQDPMGLANTARTVLTNIVGLIERLPEIKVPTLVIAGEKDRAFLPASQVFLDMIPGAERVVIEGAGHTPPVEQPLDFDLAMVQWLAKVVAGRKS